MKKVFSIFFFTALLLIVSQSVYSQGFPYHLYDTRTINELIELNLSVPDIDKFPPETKHHVMISAKPFYSAIRFEYMGKSRPVSEERMKLFKLWQAGLGIDPKLFDMLNKEFLFKECDKEYWIPVQKPAADDFPKDFKKGDRITLYLMMVGGQKEKGTWDFVFFTNSFKIYQ